MESGIGEKKKMFDEISLRTTGRSTVSLLAVAVLVLGVSFIVLVSCGVWYISDIKDNESSGEKCAESEDSLPTLAVPREFNIGMPRYHNGTFSISHSIVWVDEVNEIEYVTMKDPTLNHVMYILLIDHRRDIEVIWGSEIAECLFVPGAKRSLASDLEFLWQNNGLNVSIPDDNYNYRRGERITDMQLIPPQMAHFCSVSNSLWMREAERENDSEYQICVCAHAYCWCTFCPDIYCLGRCGC